MCICQPALSWGYRPLCARSGAGAGAAAPAAPARGQVQWSTGSGLLLWPRTLGPTTFYFFKFSRRGKVAEIDAEVRATRPIPALARAQRPHPPA